MRRLLVCAALLLSACGGDSTDEGVACTMELRPGIMVNVVDDATGAAASCGAQAVITAVGYSEIVENPAGPSCPESFALRGAAERPGTYTVTVSKPLYHDATLGPITVTAGVCHVNTVTVTARLIRL
jgi:hypothetical protein